MNVFLSASVPLPTRDHKFHETADVVAIRDAVKSLVIEVARHGILTFGGHQAITPLISLVMRQSFPEKRGSFVLFQSAYFLPEFPPENDDFIDVRVTPAVANNENASLQLMRQQMLSHCDFDAGFFIGGMEGVMDEFEVFRDLQPNAPAYPIASTGAAALTLFRQGVWDERLETELTYPTLFRQLLAA